MLHRTLTLWTVTLALSLSGALPAEAAPRLAQIAIGSDAERAGDADALAQALLDGLRRYGDDPRSELLARRLADLVSDLSDPYALEEELTRLATGGALSGWTETPLERVLALLAAQRGDRDGAAARRARDGHLRTWWVIGPFGKTESRSLDYAYGVETQPGLDVDHADGWQQLRWQRIEIPPDRSSVRPTQHLHPRSGTFYAQTELRAATAIDVCFERESADELLVWLNGTVVVRDVNRPTFEPSPRRSLVRLSAGWNRVLVKCRGSFRLRLTDPGGRPIDRKAVEISSHSELHEASAPEEQPTAPVRTPLAVWVERVLGPREQETRAPSVAADAVEAARDAAGLARLAIFYDRDDLAVEAAERALELAPDEPSILYHTGQVFRYAGYLPDTVRKTQAETSFQRCVEIDPKFLPAYERVARYLEEDAKYGEAATTVEKALAQNPRFVRGLFRLRSIYRTAEWTTLEHEVIERLAKVLPKSPLPHAVEAERYESLGNPAAARSALEKAYALDRASVDRLREIGRLAWEQGALADAEKHYRAYAEVSGRRRPALDALARFLADTGRFDEALEIRRRVAAENPQSPTLALAVARTLEAAGAADEARKEYERALSLDPGQSELERYLRSARWRTDEATSDEFALWDERLEDWMDRVPAEGPLVDKASGIVVLDIAVLRLRADGSSTEYTHQAFRLLSDEAVESLSTVPTPGEVILLRSIDPDGNVLEPVPATGRGAYDMPGLKVGSWVEFAYRVDRSRPVGRPLRGSRFYFQDPQFEQSFFLSRYVVVLDPGVDAEVIESNLDVDRRDGGPEFARVTKTESELEGGARVIVYEAREVPRLVAEPFQPSADELIPAVRVAAASDWDEVAHRLHARVARSARVTSEVRRAAAAATEGLETDDEKVRALYEFVNDSIVSPRGSRSAAAVLLEKAGDRTVLFKALLDAAQVRSSWAFLRPNEEFMPAIDWRFPSTSSFQARPYVCLEAPGAEPRFITLAQRNLPIGLLPEVLPGGVAYIIAPDASRGRLVSLRGLDPASIASSFDVDVTLDGNGPTASVVIDMTSRVFAGFAQKDRMKTIQEFQRRFALQGMATRLYPGARLTAGEFHGLDDDEPFRIHMKLESTRVLESGADGEFLFRPIPQPLQLVRSYGGKAEREHSFVLRAIRVSRDVTRLRIPDGFAVARLPAGATLLSSLGSYSLQYEPGAGEVVVRRDFTLRPGTVEPEDVAALVEFFRAVDSAETERIVLRSST